MLLKCVRFDYFSFIHDNELFAAVMNHEVKLRGPGANRNGAGAMSRGQASRCTRAPAVPIVAPRGESSDIGPGMMGAPVSAEPDGHAAVVPAVSTR
uniref:Uncharacterized protein n=1 Tax=Setaria viridis TaxID=4556 RepID=A0A4U6UI32_SETVI|nr:hypothetical protein SEVIR_5G207450v2 [Setaria viridis]